jgi:hypothetical protein
MSLVLFQHTDDWHEVSPRWRELWQLQPQGQVVMKVGDLVLFEFEEFYKGLVTETGVGWVDILFFDGDQNLYYLEDIEGHWEVVSESR